MSARNVFLMATASALVGGVSYAALSFGVTVPIIAGLAAAFAAFAVGAVFRNRALHGEVDALREHLETTRQHAAVLARHTRELRESIIASPAFQPDLQSRASGAHAAHDFVALSSVVRDVADGLSEIDRRTEVLELEVTDLRRKQELDGRAASTAPGWVAPKQALSKEAPVREAVQSQRAELHPIPSAPEINRAPEAPRAVRQLVAAAIAADRFDLFLQRIVGIPQRKIRGYDVTLRPDSGDLAIPNAELRLAVDTLGHQLPYDRRLIVQTVRLARMFERRERDVLLFADVSQRYLMSEAAFDELSALVEEAPFLPERIILSLPQRFFKKAIAYEHEALRKLSDLGFRFLMRDVEDFEMDPQRLYQMGVRWVRADARHVIDAVNFNPTMMGVSSADFVTVLARRKIDFIASNTGDDETIAELIDLSVAFAHGQAFAPPQAVRADALEEATQPARVPEPVRAPMVAPSPANERRGLRELVRRA
jgi:EAL domain-containing protein (putative c-di-GMP-specific phosphodiesterase class I)